MDSAVVVALVGIAGTVVGIAGTLLNAAYVRRSTTRDAATNRARTREEAVQELVKRYRDPVLRASFDLQSRMFNIVEQRFLETYHVDARPDAKEYACENTLFVLADYLGWCEILRREVRFLDLGVEAQNKIWVQRLLAVRAVLQGDGFDPVLQVMHGQQRAIGELMIIAVENAAGGGPRQETMGYAAFVTRRRDDPDFARWFERLAADIGTLARTPGKHVDRLVALQRALIDLIDFLDEHCERLPRSERGKLPAHPGAGSQTNTGTAAPG